MTKREATLNERTRMYSRHTQRSAAPLRSPSFGAVECLELLRRKQAHWRARPPILRKTQSRSQRRQQQTGWAFASETPPPISSGSTKRLTGSGMPDYGFGRCDGHHEMVDSGSKKAAACACFTSPIDARCKKKAPACRGFQGVGKLRWPR